MLRAQVVGLIVVLSGCTAGSTQDGGEIVPLGALSGPTAFTPAQGRALFDFNRLSIWMHDSLSMTSGCELPRGEYKVLFLTLVNGDGGVLSLSPGTYAIKPPGQHSGEYALLRETQAFFAGSGTVPDFGGDGISGVATVRVASAARTAGEFSATLRLTSDGGASELSGSWDVAICTP